MNTNTQVALDAVKTARKSGVWDGVMHLYKVVSVIPSSGWDATQRGILHEALVKANKL